MFKIVTIPNPKLREISKPVKIVDKKVIKFSKELGSTLRHAANPSGVGLSAIQVGKTTRIFATNMPQDQSLPMTRWYDNNMKIELFIDPVINQKSKKVTLGGTKNKPFLEGCLSMPNLYGPVWRYEWIEVDYVTLDDKNEPTAMTKRFEGIQARVVQHEYDHLDGILFTDHSLEDELPVYEEQNEELVQIKIA